MIRYNFTEEELIADIRADDLAKGRKEGWLEKARRLTRGLKSPKKEIGGIWSEVKSVYTTRQKGKCAFCERLLGAHELSSVEFDVEHFRPKNAVKAWPPQDLIDELELPADFPRSKRKGRGYRMLAYHHLNYASSCKTCNSRLKGSYFPIAGRHSFAGQNPATMSKSEKPYLIYPLGNFDSDPEELITFEGYEAVPRRHLKGHDLDRARVSIAFFRLNGERDDLYLLRAKQLDSVRDKIGLLNAAKNEKARQQKWDEICRLADEANPHAGCVRAFIRLYGEPKSLPVSADRQRALQYLDLAHAYVETKLRPWSPLA